MNAQAPEAERQRLLRNLGLLAARCSACGVVGCSGFISYGHTSEPHCLSCCRAWEDRLMQERFAFRAYVLTLRDFRRWQAERRLS